MRLVLERVGNIKRAMVHIDSVTTLAGPNNSGKTTIAKALDALLTPLVDLGSRVHEKRRQSLVSSVEEWLSASFSHPMRSNLSQQLTNTIFDAFATDHSFTVDGLWLAEQLDDGTKEKIRRSKRGEEALAAINMVLRRGDEEYRDFIFAQELYHHFKGQVTSFGSKEPSVVELVDMCTLTIGAHHAIRTDLGNGGQDVQSVVYLPASRLLHDDASLATKRLYDQLSKPPIFGDRNLTLEAYESTRRNIQVFNTMIDELIGGKLVHTANTLAFVETAHPFEKINLGNVASGMLSFAYLAKLIENGTLRRNSVLIIDEPEMNLHPEWQIQFADLLVLLHKELHVISLLISHSPYFIRAVERSLAQHEIKGSFYRMRREEGSLLCDDVTDDLKSVYNDLYRPFEEL